MYVVASMSTVEFIGSTDSNFRTSPNPEESARRRTYQELYPRRTNHFDCGQILVARYNGFSISKSNILSAENIWHESRK